MLGYQYSEDGKVEAQDKFLRRMSGVMRLYAAILVTPLKNSLVAEGKKHPLHMKEAWRWFTATLNLSMFTKHLDRSKKSDFGILNCNRSQKLQIWTANNGKIVLKVIYKIISELAH